MTENVFQKKLLFKTTEMHAIKFSLKEGLIEAIYHSYL